MTNKIAVPKELIEAANEANVPELAVKVFYKILHIANQYSEQTVIENVKAVIKSGFFDEFKGE